MAKSFYEAQWVGDFLAPAWVRFSNAAAEGDRGSRGQEGHDGDNGFSAVACEDGGDLHDAHQPARGLKTVRQKAGLEADNSVATE